jgi:hypothetical protein
MDPSTYRVPLETAHELLVAFGITRSTQKYERWVKDDGFDLKDFDEVLFESPFIYIIDWRAWLQEELETISSSLVRLGVQLRLELDADGEAGYVACDDRRAPVAYRPSDGAAFDDVIQAVQSVVPQSIEFRASPGNGGGDTLVYAALPTDSWTTIESVAPDVVRYFFVPLARN